MKKNPCRRLPASDPPREERHPVRDVSLTAGTAVLALLASVVLLLGCATPTAAPPSPALAQARDLGAASTTTPWPEARWWSRYGDATLDKLVDQALAGQPALQVV